MHHACELWDVMHKTCAYNAYVAIGANARADWVRRETKEWDDAHPCPETIIPFTPTPMGEPIIRWSRGLEGQRKRINTGLHAGEELLQ